MHLNSSRGRRALPAVLAATALALGLPVTVGASSAQAALTGPGVQPGHNITVTADLDLVAVYGLRSGALTVVEVVRRNPQTQQEETIGRVVAPARTFKSGVGLEVNHGPIGTAVAGDCWDQQTPDIRPGDRIVVTSGGRTDEVTVDDIAWTSAATVDPATQDVVLDGAARRGDGTPIPAAALDAGEFRNTTGKYRIQPDLVEETGPDGEFRVHYRAPYTGFRNRENLTEDQRRTALLTENQHTIGYGDLAVLPAETQTRNGLTDLSGPALGCEAAPAGVVPLAPRDDTAPTVTARTPADGATDVPVDTDVTATFSEDVSDADGRNFSLRDAGGTSVSAAIGYDATTRVVTLHPNRPLTAGTVYTAALTDGVLDTIGNPLAPASWTFTTAASSDAEPPAVTATSPAAGAVGVALDAPVSATFSENVSGVAWYSFTVAGPDGGVPGDVTYDAATRTATFTPTVRLAPGSSYSAFLDPSITDVTGNPLPATAWAFTTPGAADQVLPTVVDRAPADGTIGVPATATVTATFSEDVAGVPDGFALAGPDGAAVPADVGYDPATRVATLTPRGPLAAGARYTATIGAAVTDIAGNPLAPVSWHFTTVAATPADTVAPTVTGRTPAASATGVTVGTPVTATFSEPVSGVDGAGFGLTGPGGVPVSARVAYDAASRTATLTPAAALAAGSRYTAALTGAVTDAAGNQLAATTWSFTTAGSPTTDAVAPTVTTRSPRDGATQVATGTAVTGSFSEPVSGVAGTTFVLTGPTGAVPAKVTYATGSRVATLTPTTRLAPGTRYSAALTDGIADRAGNRLTATTWSFTTAGTPPADAVAPTIVSRTPAVNATGVRTKDNVTITLSERVSGVNGTTVQLRTGTGTSVRAVVRYNSSTGVATLDPSGTLQAGQQYRVTLTNGIRDAAGNRLAATTWSFTTA